MFFSEKFFIFTLNFVFSEDNKDFKEYNEII